MQKSIVVFVADRGFTSRQLPQVLSRAPVPTALPIVPKEALAKDLDECVEALRGPVKKPDSPFEPQQKTQ
jgi:hypothetical protein